MGALVGPDRTPIRVRLVAYYAAFLLLSFGIAGVFALTALEKGMMRQVDTSLNLRTARVQQQVEGGWDGGLDRSNAVQSLADVEREVSLSTPVIWVQILDTTGILLASAPALRPAQLPPTHALVVSAVSGQDGYTNLNAGPDRVRVLARTLVIAGQVVGVMVVAESLHTIDSTFREVISLLPVRTRARRTHWRQNLIRFRPDRETPSDWACAGAHAQSDDLIVIRLAFSTPLRSLSC